MRPLILLVALLVLPLAAKAADETDGAVVPMTPTQNVPAAAAPKPTVRATITVQAGQGRVVTLPDPAANVFVANPKVAEVRPASPDSLFVFGNGPGTTTLAALDASGRSIAFYTVVVAPSGYPAGAASGVIRRTLPGENARLHETMGGVTMDGAVETPDEADRAVGAARDNLPPGQSVQNRLRVRSGVQVLLQVHIAEMARQVTRQLGVNWQALGTVGRYSVGFATANPLLVTTGVSALTNSYINSGASISNIIQALAQNNLARMLAEPNLTAMSGETASFLVGGEFPIPISQINNAITIAFKQYGVSLAFVPTVLSHGRINLHVRTEVSQLTQAGAVQLSASNNSIVVPALTVRRAETTVELGSGQSFAIAGLLQDTVTQQDNSVPWLGEIPYLGSLFRSSSFQHNKSELVVIVTPVIAQPVDRRAQLHTPDEEYVPPGDVDRFALLRQTRHKPRPVAGTPTIQGFVVQ